MIGSSLVDFLLARIAEDEASARAATGGTWLADPPHGWDDWDELLVYSGPLLVTPGGGEMGDGGLLPADARHVARWDPARVLAECEAKRWIVGAMSRYRPNEAVPRNTLRYLAVPYAAHPDFDEAWRP